MTQEAKDSSGNYVSTKYITTYSNGTSTFSGTSIYTTGKTGDATKEVYIGSSFYGWLSDFSIFAHSSYPFFLRGGSYGNGSNTGVFSSDHDNGVSDSNFSFRAVLCPLQFDTQRLKMELVQILF